MGTPLLSLERVSKSFGRVRVADQLSIEVADGEVVGVVGPNGAGKTSLFSIISGDLAADEGRVIFDAKPVTTLGPAARCRLGMGRTYQVPRPFEHMTVFENVLVAAEQGAPAAPRAGRARAARARAIAALEETGLADAVNRPAGRLTLLARKRLELARALATGPRLLLLDEVAGGLTDPEVDELVAIVAAQRARGLTVIWIEHVVHALTRSVDRLIALAGGAVIADGVPDEVLASSAVRDVYLGVDVEISEAS
jgi:branched-chain amino acid transport system ATP-binding protein